MFILMSAVPLLIVVGALIDIILREDWQVKHLPKLVWILLVILLPLIGSIVWFAVGREYSAPAHQGTFGDPRRWEAQRAPERMPARTLSTEEQLAAIDREIEYHENQARIARLEAEVNRRRGAEQ